MFKELDNGNMIKRFDNGRTIEISYYSDNSASFRLTFRKICEIVFFMHEGIVEERQVDVWRPVKRRINEEKA